MTASKYLLTRDEVATHEAAHLIVFLFVGGSADIVGSARIRTGSGSIVLNDPKVYENYFAQTCVELAGPVFNNIIGRNDIDRPSSSDMQNANRTLNCRHRYKEDCVASIPFNNELGRAWRETERILLAHWPQVRLVAAEFSKCQNKSGEVSRSNVRKIAESILREWKAAGVDYHSVQKRYWRSEFGLPAPTPKVSPLHQAEAFTIRGYLPKEIC